MIVVGKHISHAVESHGRILITFCEFLIYFSCAVVVLGALHLPVYEDTHYHEKFVHTISYGPFCCQVGQTPEIIGYYAANLNAGILTVKSANPNALLFAFKNWTYPRAYWEFS